MTQRDAPSSEGNLCSVFDTGTFCLECVTGHNWGGGKGIGERVGKGSATAHPQMAPSLWLGPFM